MDPGPDPGLVKRQGQDRWSGRFLKAAGLDVRPLLIPNNVNKVTPSVVHQPCKACTAIITKDSLVSAQCLHFHGRAQQQHKHSSLDIRNTYRVSLSKSLTALPEARSQPQTHGTPCHEAHSLLSGKLVYLICQLGSGEVASNKTVQKRKKSIADFSANSGVWFRSSITGAATPVKSAPSLSCACSRFFLRTAGFCYFQ